jgi:hypothetical protein
MESHVNQRIQMNHDSYIPVTTATDTTVSSSSSSPPLIATMELVLSDDTWILCIFSFLGDGYYRFVGAVNQQFHRMYMTLYPQQQTYYNISTIQHTLICFREYRPSTATTTAAATTTASAPVAGPLLLFLPVPVKKKHGDPEQASYLCTLAARKGNLLSLQFLRETLHCTWDASVGMEAARNGHVHLLQWARQNGCP